MFADDLKHNKNITYIVVYGSGDILQPVVERLGG